MGKKRNGGRSASGSRHRFRKSSKESGIDKSLKRKFADQYKDKHNSEDVLSLANEEEEEEEEEEEDEDKMSESENDEDEDGEPKEEPVFDLNVEDSSDSEGEEHSDDESSSDNGEGEGEGEEDGEGDKVEQYGATDDDPEEAEDLQRESMAWGNKPRDYFRGEREEEMEMDDEEAAEDEEREVQRLKRKQLAKLTDEDFDFQFDFGGESVDGKDVSGNKKGDKEARKKKKQKKKGKKDISSHATATATDTDKAETEKEEDDDKTLLTKNKKTVQKGQKHEQDELEKLIADAPELPPFVWELQQKSKELEEVIIPLIKKVENGEIQSKQGISYLETKYHLLLSYCTNVTFYLYMKAQGQPTKEHPVMNQIVRLRTVMDKLRPLDAKLKHQIDDLINASNATAITNSQNPNENDGANQPGTTKGRGDRAAMNGNAEGHVNPLRFRPNLDALGDDDDNNNNNDDDDEGKRQRQRQQQRQQQQQQQQQQRYVVPKLVSTPFEEQEKESTKQEKEARRRMDKLKRSRMLQDLQAEFSDRPVEVSDDVEELDRKGLRDQRIEAERRRYEEENFTRLVETKKDRQRRMAVENRKATSGLGALADLESFGDIARALGPELGSGSEASNSMADLRKQVKLGASNTNNNNNNNRGNEMDRNEKRGEEEEEEEEEEDDDHDDGLDLKSIRRGTNSKGNSRPLTQYLNEMDQTRNNISSRKNLKSGDEDVVLRDPDGAGSASKSSNAKSQTLEGFGGDYLDEHNNSNNDDDDDADDADPDAVPDDDDDLYKSIKNSKKQAKTAKKDSYQFPLQPAPEPTRFVKEGDKRKATYGMIKNKGLKPHRKKEDRNPRVRMKKRFEKKAKSRKGQVRETPSTGVATQDYQGEKTGIHSRVVRSRRPGQ